MLLHLVREDFPNVKAMFVDTGLEYPEVRAFAMAQENVDVVRPKLTFKEVIKTKGYPFIGKEVSKNIYYAIELVLLSNHHIIWLLLLLPSIFPSIRVFSSESALCIRWPEYWSFSISPSNEYSGLISYKID